jgi:outer membrane protein OmpA-like peptidoglycan-associated protein
MSSINKGAKARERPAMTRLCRRPRADGITSRQLASKCTILLLSGLLSECALHPNHNFLERDYNQLNRRLASEISQRQVQIFQLQNSIKIAVNCKQLFPSGGWEMPTAATEAIARITPVVAPLQQTRIIVTGYTDNASLGAEFQRQTNLQLSFMRAQTIMQILISHGVDPSLVMAQGLEGTDMVSPNDVPGELGRTSCIQITLVGSGN